MMIIGLTGGIASGKSTVSKWFIDHHITVIDSDKIAREVVEKGEPALDDIMRVFGKRILHQDGTLNRGVLGEIVFQSSEKKRQLDHIMQPRILSKIKQQISMHSDEKVIVLDLPLLFEMGYDYLVDDIIVVAVDFETQVHRLQKRNHLTEEQAIQRIKSQLPLVEKIKRADFVVDNNGSREKTYQQVEKIIKRLGIELDD